jgi:hypothetical protein
MKISRQAHEGHKGWERLIRICLRDLVDMGVKFRVQSGKVDAG